jgi:hypothetical protein
MFNHPSIGTVAELREKLACSSLSYEESAVHQNVAKHHTDNFSLSASQILLPGLPKLASYRDF